MEQLRIDLVPMGVTPNAHASQFDVGRVIRFLLYNGGTAYTLAGTETITVKMAKPDGTEETVSVTNTSSNYVDFVTTDGLLNQVGLYPCEISITSGTDVIGSKNFNLRVELDPYDGHNIRTVTVGPADICTFTTALPEFLPSVTVNVVATGGNGTPDNPNPINGYSSANITRCGVNLYSDIFSEYRKPVNYYIKNIPLTVGKRYSLKATLTGTAVSGCVVGIAKDGDGYPFTGPYNLINSDGTINTISSILIDETWTNPKLIIYASSEALFNSLFENYEILLVEGTDTTYHAYNGQTYAIAFGQTVYGGVLDVTRGKLTVTHGFDLIDGSVYFSMGTTTTFRYFNSNVLSNDSIAWNTNVLTNMFGTQGHYPYAQISGSARTLRIAFDINDTSITTVTQLQTLLNQTPLQVVYLLATPFDIDLTPVQIRALVGENNVFADCGETEVEYIAEGT